MKKAAARLRTSEVSERGVSWKPSEESTPGRRESESTPQRQHYSDLGQSCPDGVVGMKPEV